MKTFYKILGNGLIVTIANFFMWSVLTYWAYLETKSVLATSILAGIYLVSVTLSGFWLGSIVDHNKKKNAMLMSSFATLILFIIAFIIYNLAPTNAFKTVGSVWLWSLAIAILFAVIAGNIRNITLPTVVGILVPEDKRDKANGLSGTVVGIAFAVSSVAAGFALALIGMFWVLVLVITLTIFAIIHLLFISIPEKEIIHTNEKPKKIDIKGTLQVIKSVPGFLGLIFFTTFNNFLGGVFMPLLDAYGLSLVKLEVWGVIWGFLSLGFIIGGIIIAKKGLGKNPVKTLFRVNSFIWFVCIIMAVQPSIILLIVCMFVYLCTVPFIEASEQTIVQKVVPPERLGRVFGVAQSIETSAAPLTAFVIGPIAQFIFIPFMTNGKGVELIGGWFGVGPGRGIALVFIAAGIVGSIVTFIAKHSRSYKLLSSKYEGEQIK